MSEHGSWFAPKNARNVMLGLSILLWCNVLSMEAGFLAWLVAVEPDEIGQSVLEKALNRTRGTTSLYTRVFMLSGLIFFIILASVALWLYSGKNRLAWGVGALGMLIRTGSRVLWRYGFESPSASEITAAIFMNVTMALAMVCFLYCIFSPREFIAREYRIALGVGIFILHPVLAVAFFLDNSGTSTIVIEVVGLVTCCTSYGLALYVKDKEETTFTETEALLTSS